MFGWTSPSEVAGFEFNASESVTFALSTQIIQQQNNFNPTVFADQHQAKIDVLLYDDSDRYPWFLR